MASGAVGGLNVGHVEGGGGLTGNVGAVGAPLEGQSWSSVSADEEVCDIAGYIGAADGLGGDDRIKDRQSGYGAVGEAGGIGDED